MFCVICVIIHSDRKQPAYLLWCKKRNIVVLDTPICRASSEHDVPFLRFFISSFLFSASILILGVYPFFRPKRFPSCFLRASASLVRIEIRLRSISAINPNANPSTLRIKDSHNLKQCTTKPRNFRNNQRITGAHLIQKP